MKKVNKKNKYALLGAYALMLGILAGCGKHENSNGVKEHIHLYVNVGDATIVFKECEGYNMLLYPLANRSAVKYEIVDEENNQIISGYASDYFAVTTDHTHTDDMEEFIVANNENVKIYTLNK